MLGKVFQIDLGFNCLSDTHYFCTVANACNKTKMTLSRPVCLDVDFVTAFLSVANINLAVNYSNTINNFALKFRLK